MSLTSLSTSHVYDRLLYQPVIADQLSPLIPWMPIRGDRLEIAEIAPSSAGIPGTVAWITATGPAVVNEAVPGSTARTVALFRVSGEFNLGQGYEQIYSGMIDQRQAQADIKRLLLQEKLGLALVYGNVTGALNEPSGLYQVAVSLSRTVAVASATLTLAMLDQLLDAVTSQGGQSDYLVMSGAMLKRFRSLYAGTAPSGVPTVVDMSSGRRFPAYAGVPILRDDHIPNNLGAGTNESFIVALTKDAVRFIFPAGVGDRGLVTEVIQGQGVGCTAMRLTQSVGVALVDQYGLAVLTGARP